MNPHVRRLQIVRKRLQKGRVDYGDRSFLQPVRETVEECDQELTDVVGWLFVLWCQVGELVPGPFDQDELQLHYIGQVKALLQGRTRASSGWLGRSVGQLITMAQVEKLAADVCEIGAAVRGRLGEITRRVRLRVVNGGRQGRKACES